MNYVVIPAMNESDTIIETIDKLDTSLADKILVVVNGSIDDTLNKTLTSKNPKVNVIYFNEALGYDIPRSVGAYMAYEDGCESIVFIDGDMAISSDIVDEMFYRIKSENIDMLLVNSLDYSSPNPQKNILAGFIEELNRNLGIFDEIHLATPSIGPHGVSRRLVQDVGIRSMAIPPLELCLAKKHDLNICAPIQLPIEEIASSIRDEQHANLIMDTIIGDCIYGWNVYKDLRLDDTYNRLGYTGYHNSRRFDLLQSILDI